MSLFEGDMTCVHAHALSSSRALSVGAFSGAHFTKRKRAFSRPRAVLPSHSGRGDREYRKTAQLVSDTGADIDLPCGSL